MTLNHLALIILVVLATVGAISIARWITDRALRHLSPPARGLAPLVEAGPATEAVRGIFADHVARAMGTAPQWYALACGTRLEYGATGWWIEFKPGRDVSPFTVWDPEGVRVAYGGDLAGLKRMAERLQADRAEFTPTRPASQWINPRRDP